MKNRIISFILSLTLVLSVLLGTAVLTGAEGGAANLDGTDLNLAENITVRMYVSVANAADGDYAIVTLPDGTWSKTLLADAEKSGNSYLFYAEVAVKDFAKDITLEIYSNNAVVYTATTTAKAYCENYKVTYPSGEFLPLIASLEVYAAAAAAYFDGAAAVTVDADLSAVPAMERAGTMPAGITHRSATLVLESETTVRHYFALAEGKFIENYKFFVDLDKDGKYDANEKLTPATKTDTEGNLFYYVSIDGITPNELDEAYTVGVYGVADGNTYTCTYGALTYAKSKADQNNRLATLVKSLYNYNSVASKLTGKVYFDGVFGMTYEYGVNTPIVKVPVSNNNNFIGWYDSNGVKYDTVPASYSAKTLNLTAKWATATTHASNNLDHTEGLKTGNMIECGNHTAENANDKGICKSCGYCAPNVNRYADSDKNSKCDTCGQTEKKCTCGCPFNRKPTATGTSLTCTNCGKKLANAGTKFCDISFNDNAIGYVDGVTLDGGKTPVIVVLSSGGTTYTIGGDLYGTIFNGDRTFKTTQIIYEIDLGVPTEEQCTSLLGGKTYANAPSAQTPASFGLRLGSAGANYTDFLVTAVGGKLSFTADAADGFASLPVGTTATYRIVLDFSDAQPGGGADNINVSVYDEDGNLLGETQKQTKSGYDISAYNSNLGQWRFRSGGALMVDNIKVCSNPDANRIVYPADVELPADVHTSYTPGVETPLPVSAEKADHYFCGWYADEDLTEAIDAIPANASDDFKVYAKFIKVLMHEDFSSNNKADYKANVTSSCLTSNNDGDTASFTTDAKSEYVAMGATIYASVNDVFTIELSIAKPAEGAMNDTYLSVRTGANTEIGLPNNTALRLMYIKDGCIYNSGDSDKPLIELTEELTTVKLVIDFTNGIFYIYDANDLIVYSATFSGPVEGTDSYAWKKNFRDGVAGLRWDSITADEGTTIVGDIKIFEGNSVID